MPARAWHSLGVVALRPFRALRPTPGGAAAVAAVPYDVVSAAEARDLAAGNPLSFLHVSRAEIDLPDGIDPHSDAVYERAAANLARLRSAAPLVEEDRPSVYVYRLRMGDHVQTGVAACFSVDEYEHDVIRRHERTRKDKEDDRTRHIIDLRAQTGPVFLVVPGHAGHRCRDRARVGRRAALRIHRRRRDRARDLARERGGGRGPGRGFRRNPAGLHRRRPPPGGQRDARPGGTPDGLPGRSLE